MMSVVDGFEGFGNPFEGDWSVSEGSLVLNYAPVPEPASFAGILGFAAAGDRLLRRRR
ncbi:MAG: PEP-CTERM sorting domain-containing protein [Opitutales bacterium]